MRRTPSFQRQTLSSSANRPGSSNTLPRKGSAAQQSGDAALAGAVARHRNPSGSSASGMTPSPSNGSSSATK